MNRTCDARAVLRAGCIVACVLASGIAAAQPKQPTEADRLFEEGRALAKEGKFVEACARFTKSFEIDHALGTELNLADCEEKLGHLRTAWRLFLAAADESERSDDTKRTQFARDRANALAAQLTEIVVTVATPTAPGLTITIAGHAVEPAPVIRDRTEPGRIEIIARLPDRAPFTSTVTGSAGDSVPVVVPVFGPPLAKELPTVLRRRTSRVRLAWGIGAVGGASAITATILAIKARGDYRSTADGPECEYSTVDTDDVVCTDAGDAKIADAQHLADLGTMFAIGAGVFAIGAVAVYFTAPYDRVVVVPSASAEQVGLAVRGTF